MGYSCIGKPRMDCEGKGCQRQQGFIFYAYASCPTCKCVPISPTAKKSDDVANPAKSTASEKTNYEPENDDEGNDEIVSEKTRALEWLEDPDNQKLIVAILVSIFIFVLILPAIFIVVSQANPVIKVGNEKKNIRADPIPDVTEKKLEDKSDKDK